MDFEEYTNDKLWLTLTDTVHALVMYPNHKAYTKETILPEKPEITHTELANRLRMPVGEALVILQELAEEKRTNDLSTAKGL
jgi:hypothetical protein